LDRALTFLGYLQLLALLISVLAVIHYTANHGRRIRRDFHEIEVGFFRCRQSIRKRYYTKLLAVGIDNPNTIGLYFAVDS
jgi:hypothetical protein